MSETSPAELRRLLIENANLAERLEASEADRDRAESNARALLEERNRLSENVELANAQLQEDPAAPVLTATEVSALVDRLIAGLGSQLSGLTLRDAELQLKVGVQKIGEQTAFVVPSAEFPLEELGAFHEISMRFHSAPEQ